MRGVVVEGRRRGSSLGFGSKLSLKIDHRIDHKIDHRRHSEHRLKVENNQMVIDIIKIEIEILKYLQR